MIGMQYKVILPEDYDMGIIRKRVQVHGHKTNGIQGLNFKAYLMTEAAKNGNLYNSYAPLYLWNSSEGMNNFIFKGFYDNILNSFGWQHINIGIPYFVNLEKDFHQSRYAVEYAGNISETKSLIDTRFQTGHSLVKNAGKSLGDLLIYNPDKWGYSQFSFYQEKPEIEFAGNLRVYEVLHLSQ
ncbi:DUF4865 family protein [Bacillus xiapuensis]|uniref:DUF4865 family protein n=1 Tax=Bacillus xiapuensis TaxID=2014075 RepID=A0ABU6NCL7_9BACI|nr:DUF4865 family protein [Bacillus xiapuensis]